MSTPVPRNLTERAREAWGHLARPDDPMPVGVAIDWLRERCETDDVAAVKRALYRAAADWLDGLLPYPSGRNPDTYSGGAMASLRKGALAKAARAAEQLRTNCYNANEPIHTSWAKWCEEGAFPALELCRSIEAA